MVESVFLHSALLYISVQTTTKVFCELGHENLDAFACEVLQIYENLPTFITGTLLSFDLSVIQ